MRDTFKSLAFIAGTILLCLFAGGVSPVYAAIPIALTTPGGVCQFQASKVTAVANVFAAEGVWGPGCPGYVAPPPVGAIDCSKIAPPPGLTRLTRVVVNGVNLDALKLAGFYPANTDTSDKPHHEAGGVSWRSERSTAKSSSERRWR